ncbi:MAG: helix-turn-helix domain-containing protein [Rhodospirillaceae bacterium]|nr:helix-turn-helix domain-containing protein [Rhodospirillaceae bacterium]
MRFFGNAGQDCLFFTFSFSSDFSGIDRRNGCRPNPAHPFGICLLHAYAAKLDVTEATFEVGYENVESFSRAFKKHFGFNPSKVTLGKSMADFQTHASYAVRLNFSP